MVRVGCSRKPEQYAHCSVVAPPKGPWSYQYQCTTHSTRFECNLSICNASDACARDIIPVCNHRAKARKTHLRIAHTRFQTSSSSETTELVSRSQYGLDLRVFFATHRLGFAASSQTLAWLIPSAFTFYVCWTLLCGEWVTAATDLTPFDSLTGKPKATDCDRKTLKVPQSRG